MKFKARVLLTNHLTTHLEITNGLPNLQVGQEYYFVAEEAHEEPVKQVEAAKEFAASVVTTKNPWT